MDPNEWLEQHGDALYSFAMMRLHQPAAAEDVLQETLMAGLQGAHNFREGSNVRTWLIAIMKNKIVDHLRKVTKEVPLDSEALENDTFGDQFGADEHWINAPKDWQEPLSLIEAGELKEQLLDCIGSLPEKSRTLLVLKELDGFSTDELIPMLNISSANNLWVMLSRARDRVRGCLDNKLAKEQA